MSYDKREARVTYDNAQTTVGALTKATQTSDTPHSRPTIRAEAPIRAAERPRNVQIVYKCPDIRADLIPICLTYPLYCIQSGVRRTSKGGCATARTITLRSQREAR